jgi:hypothetical protein
MSAKSSGEGPDDVPAGSWANETLPMSVRKELLERELRKLGFRRRAGPAGAQQQQQPRGEGSAHPQADAQGGGSHGE